MAEPQENPTTDPIAPETDDFDDNDSALGSETASTSSTSIGSSILRYRQENGRRYHAYKEGTYVLPNDEIENDRLDLQHHLFDLTFKGKLFTCPASKFHNVLDAGTGTGIWAIDFADQHPEAKVIGVDLSPIQPTFVPPNCSFYVDDLEDEWIYTEKFDLIYARMMTGSISDWPRFMQQSFSNLNPGGYVELVDITFPIMSDDATLPADSSLKKWTDLMLEASKILQRTLESAKSYESLLENVGFVDVVETQYKWPMNRWPKDKELKELGMWTHENVSAGIQGLSLALFTRGLGWNLEELEVFLVEVRKDMRDLNIHSYWSIYAVSAKKPL